MHRIAAEWRMYLDGQHPEVIAESVGSLLEDMEALERLVTTDVATLLHIVRRYVALYAGADGQPRGVFERLYEDARAVVQRIEGVIP